MKITIEKTHENAVIPKRAGHGDGGWDLTAVEIIQESPDFVRVILGFKTEFSKEHKITIVPRSSITKTGWILQNSPALIDSSFRGVWELRFRAFPNGIESGFKAMGYVDEFALTYPDFPFSEGDRVAQMYAEEVIPIRFSEGKVNKTARADGGFGSTGK